MLRKKIAELIYPEIFNEAHGLRICLKEAEEDFAKAKECLKGKGKLITMGNFNKELREDSPLC